MGFQFSTPAPNPSAKHRGKTELEGGGQDTPGPPFFSPILRSKILREKYHFESLK